MAVLQVENITKYYGELLLFDKLSFTINQGEKVALVASNGTGKSSLIKLIMGQDTAEGEILIHTDTKIGLLDQSPELTSDNTIYQELYDSHQEILQAQENYNKAIESGNEKEIQTHADKMETLHAWDYQTRVEQLLSLMKFPDNTKKVATLSGGQQKRVALAKLLLQSPDLLILDEPTNHLDLDMIEWLEGFLKSSSITLLMVTHDRYFLDRVCNSIIEIADAKAFKYQGNYSYYIEKKQERELLQQASVIKAKNLLRTELDWMRRQPKARGTKSKSRIDAFYDLEKKAYSGKKDEELNISVESKRLGKKIIELKNISKSYDETVLFKNFSYVFNRNEKVGIIGKNGCGKSTLLKVITNNLQPNTGSVEYGETVSVGFYKQDGLQVKGGKKVLEVITDIADKIQLSKDRIMTAAQYLEHWLFPRPMHHLHVEKLSGGEKKRLYLMTVLMKQPNFLILDEPTNDLDLTTLQILEEYLASFQGCVLIVSHDRFFTDKVVDHLFVFEENGVITDFPGNYSLYRDFVEFKKEEAQNQEKQQKQEVQKQDKPKKKKGLIYKERLELEQIEKELEELEQQKQEQEAVLNSGSLQSEELLSASEKIGQIIEKLELLEMRWLQLQEKAEEVE